MQSGLRRFCCDAGDMSLSHWILTSFLGEGGKIRQVHLQTGWGEGDEGVTSQSFSKGTAERMLPVLESDSLGAQGAWAARARWDGQKFFTWVPGLLGGP